jgi:hypothetical protein
VNAARGEGLHGAPPPASAAYLDPAPRLAYYDTRMRTLLGALALLLLSGPAPAGMFAKDLMLRQRTTEQVGAEAPRTRREQTQYFSGHTIVTEGKFDRSIIDLSARTATRIDTTGRTYLVVTFDDLNRESEQARRPMADFPAGDSQALGFGGPVSITPTGKSEKIAGYTAKEYAVQSGPVTGRVWLTDEIVLPAEAEEWRQLSSRLGNPAQPGSHVVEALAKQKGFPLRTVLTAPGASGVMTTTTEVVEAGEKPPPAELLQVPAGFTKTDLGTPAPPG